VALQAITDSDARVVLADALELSGWWDDRCRGFPVGPDTPILLWRNARKKWDAVERGDRGPEHARAVATVLLFGGWPTTRWALAETCRRDETDAELIARVRDKYSVYYSPVRMLSFDNDFHDELDLAIAAESATGDALDAIVERLGMTRILLRSWRPDAG
jgi:hypothetical protein